MQCYCCRAEVMLARKVKLRGLRDYSPAEQGGPDSAAYAAYREEITYRWAFICQGCYAVLDNEIGVAEIGVRPFNLAGASRGDKAAVVDEAKYQEFQRQEAAKMGLEP